VSSALSPDAGGVCVAVRVTPRGGRDAVAGLVVDARGDERLAVKVRAAPADGEANTAVLALLARSFGVPKSAVTLLRGETGREKRIHIAGDGAVLAARFAQLTTEN
jgi:uncharacterized protein (TIGR00251 family)